MIQKTIEFTSLDEVKCRETFSFNLGNQDFVRMQLKYQPSLEECHKALVAAGDIEGAYDMLADLIESSYGVREGNAFVKNRRINGINSRPDLANFKFHPAFDELIVQLMADTPTLIEFFRNITSVKMTEEEFDSFAKTIKKDMAAATNDVVEPMLHLDMATGPDMTAIDGAPVTQDSPVDETEAEPKE